VQAARTKAATAGERASWGQATASVESGRSLTGGSPAASATRSGSVTSGSLSVQGAVVEGAQQEPDVGAAVAQRLRLLAQCPEDHLRGQGRIVGAVGIEDLRQQAAVDVGLERDPKPPRRTACLPGPARGGSDRLQGGPGIAQQDLPGRSEPDLPGSPLKQHHAELPFKAADRAGQRGLRHAQPVGGATEVQFLGDNHEFPNALQRWQSTCVYAIFLWKIAFIGHGHLPAVMDSRDCSPALG
jgi:hypothetical protein